MASSREKWFAAGCCVHTNTKVLDLAERLNYSDKAISKWERVACYPDITFLPDIAALLGCRIDDFFAATDGSRDILYPS